MRYFPGWTPELTESESTMKKQKKSARTKKPIVDLQYVYVVSNGSALLGAFLDIEQAIAAMGGPKMRKTSKDRIARDLDANDMSGYYKKTIDRLELTL